jgi:tetratricopeptide (TPR) repeat protein
MKHVLEPTLELEKAKRKRRLVIVLVLLFAALAASLAAGPVYHRLKAWRARHLAAQAERLMAEKKFDPAAQKAKAAYLIWPGEPKAIRAVAKIQTLSGQPNAIQFWQLLLASGHATAADRRDYVELAIRMGSLNQAHQELVKLLGQEPDQPANLWLLSQLCLAQGDLPAAARFAASAREHAPTNQQYQLFAATLSFDSPDRELQARARETVWNLARGTNTLGLQALGLLGRRRGLTPEQAREIVGLLEQHPLRTIADRLLALSLRIQLEPAQRAQLLDAAVADFKQRPAEDLHQVAVWLNQQREFDRTLSLVPLEEARKRADLFVVHLDALAALDRWKEIEGILGGKAVPLPPVHLEAFKARCALKLNNPAAAAAAWRRALSAAESSLEELWWLADYAAKNGELDQARRAYRSWIGRVRDPRPGYKALADLVERTGSTIELREVLREMLKRWPTDAALRNDCAYLDLLLGEDVEEARRTAEELVAQAPGSLPHRTTLALAWYRLKEPARALEVYQGREYDWSLALPSNRAVYAAVLAANGRGPEARQLAESLSSDRLRKEEFALIR